MLQISYSHKRVYDDMYIHYFYYVTYDCVIEYIDFLPYCITFI